ncbi:MAG: glutamyl-tRNA reductase [Saprospiraceae bacterium]|nr:glutamyl-tRNA reductase [Saprospiraceae bacterium]
MLSHLKILTVTHKRTNLNEIGNFVIKSNNSDELKARLEKLKEQFELDELLYVSTCNRVMYMFIIDRELDSTFTSHFFQSVNPDLPLSTIENIDDIVFALQGEEAMEHLLDVAASIDSLVIGERQILGQMREAYEQSRQWNLSGDLIRIIFQQAVQAAKSVYANTRIGDKPVSIVSLAIQKLLNSNLPKEAKILLVGAGQTNALAAKFLAKHNYHNVVVFNRSLDKAQKIAKSLGGEAFTLEELASYRDGFDAMLVCTGATEAIIQRDLYQKILAGSKEEKVVIDLAIPNNVADDVVQEFPINYIEIEGLRQLAKENLAFREQEIVKAKRLLVQFQEEMPSLIQQRRLELAMRQVPEAIKAVKNKALNEVFQKEVETLDDSTRELLEKMLTYMEKKCIGIPMKAARELSLP